MAKAYWIATYREINDPDALAAYAKLGVQRYGRLAGATWFEARPPKLWRQDWAYARSLLSSTASRAPFRPTKALSIRPQGNYWATQSYEISASSKVQVSGAGLPRFATMRGGYPSSPSSR